MRWLRLLHLWCGLFLAIFLFVLAASGAVLTYKEDLWRLRYVELAEPAAPIGADQHARVFRAVRDLFPGEAIRQIRVPREGVAAYHVYLSSAEAFVSRDGARVIARWGPFSDPIAFLTDLHINLAAGRAGRNLAGVIGLGLALMAFSGIVLWWPLRSRFSVGSFRPRGLHRSSLLRLHRDLGAIAGALIVLFALTGSGLVYYGAARLLFNGVFGDAAPDNAAPSVPVAHPTAIADAGIVAAAQAAVPGARLTSYYPPPAGSAVHYFRLRQQGEVHPYGRSTAFVDGRTGDLLASADATAQPPGERAAQWLYPLHSARTGGEVYKLVAAITAVAVALLAVTGPVTWCQLRRRRAGNRRPR